MSSIRRLPLLLAALLAVVLFAGACDNSETIVDPGPPGFEAEVSAPVDAVLEGPATAPNDLTLGTGGEVITLPFPADPIFRDSLLGIPCLVTLRT